MPQSATPPPVLVRPLPPTLPRFKGWPPLQRSTRHPPPPPPAAGGRAQTFSDELRLMINKGVVLRPSDEDALHCIAGGVAVRLAGPPALLRLLKGGACGAPFAFNDMPFEVDTIVLLAIRVSGGRWAPGAHGVDTHSPRRAGVWETPVWGTARPFCHRGHFLSAFRLSPTGPMFSWTLLLSGRRADFFGGGGGGGCHPLTPCALPLPPSAVPCAMSAGPHTTSDGGVWTGTPPSRGGGGWHKASVSDCLPLAAPIGLSPLCIPILCVVFGGGSAPLRAILPRQAAGGRAQTFSDELRLMINKGVVLRPSGEDALHCIAGGVAVRLAGPPALLRLLKGGACGAPFAFNDMPFEVDTIVLLAIRVSGGRWAPGHTELTRTALVARVFGRRPFGGRRVRFATADTSCRPFGCLPRAQCSVGHYF